MRYERADIKRRFRPILPLIDTIVDEACMATTMEKTKAAHPEITRPSHLNRLRGAKRWMIASDRLASLAPEFPEGFGLWSNEADHNASRYVFQWPGGVFTFRKHHHVENEGTYLERPLDAFNEQHELLEGVENSGIVLYVSVDADGDRTLIATHEASDKPISIPFEELREPDAATAQMGVIKPPTPGARVRSALTDQVLGEQDRDIDEADQ